MYFDQEKKEYVHHNFPGGYEVLSGIGNISLLDGEPFVHVHITLADKEGKAMGGHLDEGTKVWLIEASISKITISSISHFDKNSTENLGLPIGK